MVGSRLRSFLSAAPAVFLSSGSFTIRFTRTTMTTDATAGARAAISTSFKAGSDIPR
jgi:hypothetical protein